MTLPDKSVMATAIRHAYRKGCHQIACQNCQLAPYHPVVDEKLLKSTKYISGCYRTLCLKCMKFRLSLHPMP